MGYIICISIFIWFLSKMSSYSHLIEHNRWYKEDSERVKAEMRERNRKIAMENDYGIDPMGLVQTHRYGDGSLRKEPYTNNPAPRGKYF